MRKGMLWLLLAIGTLMAIADGYRFIRDEMAIRATQNER